MGAAPAHQRTALSAGIALGFVLCGQTTLPFVKWRIDFAFDGAWRSWAYRGLFPEVDADLSRGLDGAWAMVRADEAKSTGPLFWDHHTGPDLVVRTREGWSPSEPADVRLALGCLDNRVPQDGWTALARDVLDRYGQ